MSIPTVHLQRRTLNPIMPGAQGTPPNKDSMDAMVNHLANLRFRREKHREDWNTFLDKRRATKQLKQAFDKGAPSEDIKRLIACMNPSHDCRFFTPLLIQRKDTVSAAVKAVKAGGPPKNQSMLKAFINKLRREAYSRDRASIDSLMYNLKVFSKSSFE